MKMKVVVGLLQEERARGEHNLTNITKTHERMQIEQKSECPGQNKRNGKQKVTFGCVTTDKCYTNNLL